MNLLPLLRFALRLAPAGLVKGVNRLDLPTICMSLLMEDVSA